MENAATILVIILSIVLSIFLIFGTILVIKLIQLMRVVRQIAEKAHGVTGNVEAATAMLKKAAGPLAVGKLLTSIANVILKKRSKGG
ncbi:hypothetical protein H0V99_02705 [Candidatus Saccharibacteria bacterium]|nr:hypothetical protein [Candidatus Saccharibacteria bacterium]